MKTCSRLVDSTYSALDSVDRDASSCLETPLSPNSTAALMGFARLQRDTHLLIKKMSGKDCKD